MTLEQQVRQNPMTWKDWFAAGSLVVTLATVSVQGGRIVEKLDATNAKLAAMDARMGTVQQEIQRLGQDVTAQRGMDRLHDEQIVTLRRDLDALYGRRSR